MGDFQSVALANSVHSAGRVENGRRILGILYSDSSKRNVVPARVETFSIIIGGNSPRGSGVGVWEWCGSGVGVEVY